MDTDSAADVSAAIASVVAVMPPSDRLNTGDTSSRERERERDRDQGAETEVEPDTGMSRLGSLRGRRMPGVTASTYLSPLDAPELVEDIDEEMEDAFPLPPLPEGSPVVDWNERVPIRESSISPVPVPVPAPGSAYANGSEEFSDDEEEGSGEGGSDGSTGNVGEAAHGKRKRRAVA